ncbi:MAG: metal ABC transporter permease [Chloroflexi bacterium]|nr:metal ABC transporter permease [Chloroflexota bacterium]
MINALAEALQFTFMRHALLAGLLVSVACGIIGTYVVVKRIVFISGGIAHAAYGGIGLGYYVKYMVVPVLFAGSAAARDPRPGYWPLLGAILFSLLAAALMGHIQRRTRQRADTIIGVLWAIGMAIGIVLVDLTRGYKVDLMSYLFGSILAVERLELLVIAGLDVLVVALVTLFYKELLAVSFDETFATVQNVPVGGIYALLLGMIALTVVMLMRVVGLILVIAMLTIPPAISGRLVRGIVPMMALSALLGVAFTTLGLWLSYAWNLTSGASIILVAGTGYLLSLLATRRGAGPSAGPRLGATLNRR